MHDAEQLERLIVEIYDAALDPSRWPSTLSRIAAAFDGNAMAIHDKNFRSNQHSFLLQVGFPEDALKAYGEHFMAIDPRLDLAHGRSVGQIVSDPTDIDASIMDHHEFYQDFLRPLDMRYFVGSALENSAEAVAAVSIQRSPKRGPFDPDDIRSFARLVPHFRRALIIQRHLGSFQMREMSLLKAVDRLPHGVIVLDQQARPVLMNMAAEKIISARDGLAIGAQGLAASRSDETAVLRRIIAQVLGRAEGQAISATSAVKLSRPSGKRPLLAWIVPGPSAPRDDRVPGETHALLLVSDPDRSPQIVLSPPFIQFYGLTRTEAGLLEALANGLSLKDAHAKFGVSMETVRSHVKSIYSKVGVNRQTDLIRLIYASPLQLTASDETSPPTDRS